MAQSRSELKFPGVWTAMTTPFRGDGSIDWEVWKRQLDAQVAGRVQGVVPAGTTGESPTLTKDEKIKLFEVTATHLRGSGVFVMGGTGSNNTAETIEITRLACDVGVDAALLVTPYYNKPTQAGIQEHFLAAAERGGLPIMLYNVPGRTALSISVDVIIECSKHPQIQAIKEASGFVTTIADVKDGLDRHHQSLAVLSGDDLTFAPAMMVGCEGVVSVASNVFPVEVVDLWRSCQDGDWSRAKSLQARLYPVFRDLFVETNPGPVKWMMAEKGFGTAQMRAPLAQMQNKSIEVLRETCVRAQLL